MPVRPWPTLTGGTHVREAVGVTDTGVIDPVGEMIDVDVTEGSTPIDSVDVLEAVLVLDAELVGEAVAVGVGGV